MQLFEFFHAQILLFQLPKQLIIQFGIEITNLKLGTKNAIELSFEKYN